jgi:hypothetical protein
MAWAAPTKSEVHFRPDFLAMLLRKGASSFIALLRRWVHWSILFRLSRY